MTKNSLHISAIDTLMFRDGRPFNQNDAGASEAVSVFPPHPPTIVGAVRAALWKQNGTWDKEKLGDGTNWQKQNTLAKDMCFGAPILIKNGDPYFPVPLHILEGNKSENCSNKDITKLIPSNRKYKCDRGDVSLPVPENSKLLGVAPIEDRWVNKSGMEKILNGGVPDKNDLINIIDLWKTEPRVGIGINSETRIVSDAALYMASHTRMHDDVSLYVSLDEWSGNIKQALRPLAGEHRMAEIIDGDKVSLPDNATDFEDDRWCIIALSPVVPDNKGEILGLNNENIVSACLGKPVSIGGWDSQNKKPIALRQCIPAGSVWFMEGDTNDLPTSIGMATKWGFGQVLIGKWKAK